MIYGKIIFLKKNGGDGSKYPVTEKIVTIGRSEQCLIRIYNPQISPEHCQLIIDDSGQVKLKNFSTRILSNDKPLERGDVPLCHGDILTIGHRRARWEYHPSSKYYQKLISSSDRLVAVVKPQQRSQDSPATPQSSSSLISMPKSAPHGTRRFSQKGNSENESGNKILSASASKIHNGGSSNIMLGSQRPQSAKVLFESDVKRRKSNFEIDNYSSKRQKNKQSSLSPSESKKIAAPTNPKPVRRKSTPIRKSLSSNYTKKCQKLIRQNSQLRTSNLNIILESQENDHSKRSNANSTDSPAKNDASVVSNTPKTRNNNRAEERRVKSERKSGSNARRDSLAEKVVKRKRFSLASEILEKTARARARKKIFPSSPVVDLNDSKSSIAENSENVSKMGGTESTKKSNSKKKLDLSQSTLIDKNSVDDKRNSTRKLRTSATNSPRSNVSRNSAMKKRPTISAKSNSPPANSSSKLQNSYIFKAEKAARKLKTLRPRKPDKNKKAALLVLGKANWKKKSAKNIKLLLNKKIVKKAIKQSTAPKGLKVKRKLPRQASKKLNNDRESKKDEKLSDGEKSLETKEIRRKSSKVNKSSGNVETTDKMPKSVSSSVKMTAASFLPDKTSTPSITERFASKEMKSPDYFHFFDSWNRSLSKNEENEPEILELSPTTLGLIPKNFESIFKCPSERKKRRSLMTPRNNNNFEDIMKSASVTVGNKRNKRKLCFSSSRENESECDSMREFSIDSILGSNRKTPFKFENFQTSNISLENFVSPLAESGSESRMQSYDSYDAMLISELKEKDDLIPWESLKDLRSPACDKKQRGCASKFPRSPESENVSKGVSAIAERDGKSSRSVTKKRKTLDPSENANKMPRMELTGGDGTSQSFATSKAGEDSRNDAEKLAQVFSTPRTTMKKVDSSFRKNSKGNTKSPRSENVKNYSKCGRDLTQSNGVEELFGSPTGQSKSSGDVGESFINFGNCDLYVDSAVCKLRKSPRLQNSPADDWTNTFGVHRRSPQKSTKNYLSDLRGVKKLLRSPRIQKDPKNDLSDLRGVKKLLGSPRIQKDPKNDLSDLGGVKKLLRTPRIQKGPKNDLSDLGGVKKLLRTPRIQKGPKNDLSDLGGVKKLLRTPRIQKGPKNDLSDLRGVKKLLRTPRIQKGPKNDLSDLRGVRDLLGSPKIQRGPKNDLSDLRGVRKLLGSPKIQKDPKNDLSDLRGVRKLLGSPRIQKNPKNDLSDLRGVRDLLGSPKIQRGPKNDLSDLRGVRKLLGSPRIQKNPKNDLSDLRGVRKLLGSPRVQNLPRNSLSNLDGVEELFQTGAESAEINPRGDKVDTKLPRRSLRGKKSSESAPDRSRSKSATSEGINLRSARGKSTRGKRARNDVEVTEEGSKSVSENNSKVNMTEFAQDDVKESAECSRSTRSKATRNKGVVADVEIPKKSAGKKEKESTEVKKKKSVRLAAKNNDEELLSVGERKTRNEKRMADRKPETAATAANDSETKVNSKRARSGLRVNIPEVSPPKTRRKNNDNDGDDKLTSKKVSTRTPRKATRRVAGADDESKNKKTPSGSRKTVEAKKGIVRKSRSLTSSRVKSSTSLGTGKGKANSMGKQKKKANNEKDREVKIGERKTRSRMATDRKTRAN